MSVTGVVSTKLADENAQVSKKGIPCPIAMALTHSASTRANLLKAAIKQVSILSARQHIENLRPPYRTTYVKQPARGDSRGAPLVGPLLSTLERPWSVYLVLFSCGGMVVRTLGGVSLRHNDVINVEFAHTLA